MADSKITAYFVPSENVHKQAISIIKKLKGYHGVIVSIAKPAQTTLEELKKANVNTTNLFFIDTKEKSTSDQVVSISSTSALTELSIAVSQLLQANHSSKRYLLIEGIGVLTVHNSPQTVQKFIQFIISKLRLWGVDGHLIINNTANKDILSLLIESSDDFVK